MLPIVNNPQFQPRRLLAVPFIAQHMRKASCQQWNILELLYLVGDGMPLTGSWKEQRAVRGLVRRRVLVVAERITSGRILSVKLSDGARDAIGRVEMAIKAGFV